MPYRKLTQKVDDLSTPAYFHFRFYCDLCNEAVDSPRKHRGKDGEFETDNDLIEALVSEAKQSFRFCEHCQNWVCREVCWDAVRCQCERCALSPFWKNKKGQQSSQNEGEKQDEHQYSSILGPLEEN
ncbi:MAG: hypothetical protein K2X01_02635 [Cyanobacteria bacterium]|nr:hypothetical protein [Cyanobacteriota bacterium]